MCVLRAGNISAYLLSSPRLRWVESLRKDDLRADEKREVSSRTTGSGSEFEADEKREVNPRRTSCGK